MPSSVIRAFRYSPRRRELGVLFQTGREYTYFGVPAETYSGMRAASSKGEFFNRHIRGRFAFKRNLKVRHES
jgi:hypothetical protein